MQPNVRDDKQIWAIARIDGEDGYNPCAVNQVTLLYDINIAAHLTVSDHNRMTSSYAILCFDLLFFLGFTSCAAGESRFSSLPRLTASVPNSVAISRFHE